MYHCHLTIPSVYSHITHSFLASTNCYKQFTDEAVVLQLDTQPLSCVCCEIRICDHKLALYHGEEFDLDSPWFNYNPPKYHAKDSWGSTLVD
jgi:hypothetical protein